MSSQLPALYLLVPTFDLMDSERDLFVVRAMDPEGLAALIGSMHAQAGAGRQDPDTSSWKSLDPSVHVRTDRDEGPIRYAVVRGGQPLVEMKTAAGWVAAPYMPVTETVMRSMVEEGVKRVEISIYYNLVRWGVRRGGADERMLTSISLDRDILYRLATMCGTLESRLGWFTRFARSSPEAALRLMEYGAQYYDGERVHTVHLPLAREHMLPLLQGHDRGVRSQALLAATRLEDGVRKEPPMPESAQLASDPTCSGVFTGAFRLQENERVRPHPHTRGRRHA